MAAIGHSKDYSLKQYLVFVEKMQTKAKVGQIHFNERKSDTFLSVFELCLKLLPILIFL